MSQSKGTVALGGVRLAWFLGKGGESGLHGWSRRGFSNRLVPNAGSSLLGQLVGDILAGLAPSCSLAAQQKSRRQRVHTGNARGHERQPDPITFCSRTVHNMNAIESHAQTRGRARAN